MPLLNDPLVAVLLETPVPTVVLKTNAPNFTIINYNRAYEEVTYTQERNVREKTVWEAFNPEYAGGNGPTLLLEGFREAIYTHRMVQMEPLHYNIPSLGTNVVELSWWDVKIVPVIYDGIVKYLVLYFNNITGKVLHGNEIEQAIMKELTMAEDLARTNVKLSIANKNLAQSHAELINTKNQLEELNRNLEQRVFDRTKKLFESEAKQRMLIDNAPVAIAVLRGDNHVVEMANKKIITYWGKKNNVLNKPLAIALPELEGQPFIEILSDVRKSGKPYINPELCAYLNFNGVLQPRYYDMIYQPIQYHPGVTDSIFIVAVDITEHVTIRKNLEQSESTLRLAVASANIGTWEMDLRDNKISYNLMFAEILGWESSESVTYEQIIGQITAEFRQKITEVIENAIATGEDFDFTYAYKKFNDGKVIRLRSTGKISVDEFGNRTVFSGVVREVPHFGLTG